MTSLHFRCIPGTSPYPAPNLVRTAVTSGADTMRIALAGDLDAGSESHFSRSVLRILRTSRQPQLQIDLAGIELLAAAGVQALMLCHRTAAAQGRQLTICYPQPIVRRVLEVTAVLHLLEGAASPTRLSYRRQRSGGRR